MKKILPVFIGLFGAIALTALLSELNIVQAASCGNVETTVLSCSSNENGIWSLLLILIRILAAGVGVVAVGGLVYAAFLYSTSGDNASQLTLSKNNIQSVVIGLVVFVGLYSLVEFVVPGGIFNRSFSFPVASDDTGKDGKNGDSSSSDSSNNNASDETIKKARIKVATYNVLGFNHNTSASRYGDNERMQRAANIIKDNDVQAFVATEINVNEQRSLILNSLQNWGATSRQSGNQDVFIYWNKDIFKLVSSGTYNIPVIPGKPSRPQPWVRLEHKESRRQVFIYGNHLAQTSHGNNQNIGATATLGKVKSVLGKNKDFVTIIAGDMNTNDKKGHAYTIFKNSGVLSDTRHATGNKSGDNCDTHHSLGSQDCRPTRGSHIDHIWVSKKQKITVDSYRVIANDETAHISDHNPLIVTITIPASK